jgi:polar amino acid transport system substrate-binding protein
MRVLLRSLVIIFLLLMFFQSCAKEKPDSFDRIMKSKKILIGTDATYPPFESKDAETGKLVGFDIDLMNAICEKMGVQPEYIIVPFDGIISGLKNNKYDVVISSFTITPARGKR